jgi:hypothetical protein
MLIDDLLVILLHREDDTTVQLNHLTAVVIRRRLPKGLGID